MNLGARIAALGALAAALACGRVPEQALRDEQARSRRYRDAYETQFAELQALKARALAQERQRASCPAESGSAQP